MGRSTAQHEGGHAVDPPNVFEVLDKEMKRHVWRQYELNLRQFLRFVEPLPLPHQVFCLHAQADRTGFPQTERPARRRYRYVDPSGKRSLVVDLNLSRAERRAGVGGRHAAPATKVKPSEGADCFLCPTTIAFRSNFRQLYVLVTVNGQPYLCLVNPFPLGDQHTTIASAAHEPQSWGPPGTPGRDEQIARRVLDLYGVARDLPETLVMYNGLDSGATLPEHLHFHAIRRSPEDRLPIQQAADEALQSGTVQLRMHAASGSFVEIVDDSDVFPLAFARGIGLDGARAIAGLLQRWVDLVPDASANLLAVREQEEIAIYFVPRVRRFSRAPGMEGIPGSLEVAGEVVFSSPDEAARLARNEIAYETLWGMLRSIRPAEVGLLLEE